MRNEAGTRSALCTSSKSQVGLELLFVLFIMVLILIMVVFYVNEEAKEAKETSNYRQLWQECEEIRDEIISAYINGDVAITTVTPQYSILFLNNTIHLRDSSNEYATFCTLPDILWNESYFVNSTFTIINQGNIIEIT